MARAAIFNTYLSTFGGGEKSTYDAAACLAEAGFDVEVLTFEPEVPTLPQIEEFFGRKYTGFRIVSVAVKGQGQTDLDDALRARLRNVSVFINHCAASSFPNPCPLGIYMVMFPLQPGGAFTRTYDHFVCNSAYTEFYTRKLWGSVLRTTVIHPTPTLSAIPSAVREPIILSVGRFNWKGHRKNQDVLVDAFDEIVDLLPPGWRLVLVGKVNDDQLTLQNMQALRHRCRRLPISFELDCSESRKRDLLARSSLFWHGTGLGYREPEDAARMEHFGIAIVEAMCAGAIPLCYAQGGPREIVEHTESGFLFRDPEELKTFTLLLAATPALQERMRERAMARGTTFAQPDPERRLSGFFRSVVVP